LVKTIYIYIQSYIHRPYIYILSQNRYTYIIFGLYSNKPMVDHHLPGKSTVATTAGPAVQRHSTASAERWATVSTGPGPFDRLPENIEKTYGKSPFLMGISWE
jgi:hypothetical protein